MLPKSLKKINQSGICHTLGFLVNSLRLRLVSRTFIRCSWDPHLRKGGKEARLVKREKLGYAVASEKASANPTGSSEPVRPFRTVLS